MSFTALGRVEEGFRTGAKGIYHMEIFSLQYVSRIPPNSGLGNWAVEGPPCRGDRKSAFWPNLVYKKSTDQVEQYYLENDCLAGHLIGCFRFLQWELWGAAGRVAVPSTLSQSLCPEPASLPCCMRQSCAEGTLRKEGTITVRAPPGGFACTPILCFYFLTPVSLCSEALRKEFSRRDFYF